MIDKKTIRKEIKNKLLNYDQNILENKSTNICKNILDWDIFKNAKTIAFFYPLTKEVNIIPCIENALKNNKICLIPKVESTITNSMKFYQLDNQKNLCVQIKKGYKDIMEPAETLPVFDFKNNPDNFTLFFIPGYAFDKEGNRLGKGKGFYDRFFENIDFLLPNNQYIYSSVCFSFQILDYIPTESHDKKVSFIIDENSIKKAK